MSESEQYPLMARFIHWLVAFIIVGVWLIGFYSANLRGELPRGGLALSIHKAVASTVLFLVVWRLLYRWIMIYPKRQEGISGGMVLLINTVHGLLYLLVMLAVPISGWYWSSLAGHPPSVLGLLDLPSIATPDQSLYNIGMWLHRLLAWAAGVLIAIHVMAALKHHYIDKDNVLVRMLPMLKRQGGVENTSSLPKTKY